MKYPIRIHGKGECADGNIDSGGRHPLRGNAVRAQGSGNGRGRLHDRHDRLSGNADRPLLLRSDRLHDLSAHGQRGHQRYRQRERGRADARLYRIRTVRYAEQLADEEDARPVSGGAGRDRPLRRGYPRADPARPRIRHAARAHRRGRADRGGSRDGQGARDARSGRAVQLQGGLRRAGRRRVYRRRAGFRPQARHSARAAEPRLHAARVSGGHGRADHPRFRLRRRDADQRPRRPAG